MKPSAFHFVRAAIAARKSFVPTRPAAHPSLGFERETSLLPLDSFVAFVGCPPGASDDLVRTLNLKVVPLGGVLYVHAQKAHAAFDAAFQPEPKAES